MQYQLILSVKTPVILGCLFIVSKYLAYISMSSTSDGLFLEKMISKVIFYFVTNATALLFSTMVKDVLVSDVPELTLDSPSVLMIISEYFVCIT